MVSNHSLKGSWWVQAGSAEWGLFYGESADPPVWLHLWTCGDDGLFFSHGDSFPPTTTHLPISHEHKYTKHMPVATAMAVDLGRTGRMFFCRDPEEASRDVSSTHSPGRGWSSSWDDWGNQHFYGLRGRQITVLDKKLETYIRLKASKLALQTRTHERWVFPFFTQYSLKACVGLRLDSQTVQVNIHVNTFRQHRVGFAPSHGDEKVFWWADLMSAGRCFSDTTWTPVV